MKNKKLWSLGLTGVLVVTACGCGKDAETVAEEPSQAVEITERAASRSVSGDVEKEETVYVNADANGKVKNITVSNWLKNGNGADELTDVTSLKDVVNVKGDETFTQNGDTYVWAADGNDIYYQGETSETLPVDVKVTYYLDDKEISPDELAGKSGKVKIRFDYENLTSRKTVIGGEETELCVPFVAASTLILDSDKFVNVEVENGKILSDGKNTIVAGVAMPGLYDSLDLLNLEGFEDIDIPEYVEVTADATEFELGMTATILMPDVLSEMDTDDMDGFDDLKDDIEELNDATYELIDGCIELDDGVQELKDNMPDLWDGAVELDDGAKELDDGAQDLMDGADELNDGAKDIREGAKELDEGAGTLQSGVGLLNSRLPELTGGVNALAAGLQSLQNPMMLGPDGKSGDAEHPYIKTSVGLLKNGVDTLVAGVNGIGGGLGQAIAENENDMKAAENDVALRTGELTKAVAEAQKIQSELTQLAEQLKLIGAGNGNSSGEGEVTEPEQGEESGDKTDETDSVLPDEPEDEEDDPTTEITDEESSVPAEDTTGTLENNMADTPESTVTTVPEDNTAATADDAATTADDAATSQVEGKEAEESEAEEKSEFADSYLDGLSESEGMTSMGMVQLADQESEVNISDPKAVIEAYQKVVNLQTNLIYKLNEINDLQTKLRESAMNYAGLIGANKALNQVKDQVSASADAGQLAQLTEGMAALEASIGQIYDGVALINSQMGTLTGGAVELGNGIGALKTGTDTLKAGTKKLYEGGIDLREGTKELYDGTQELKDGTEELRDGTQELKDGVVDLIDGVDELKDGTEELLDGVYEYNDDGIQKLYDTVNVDLQNLLDRVDAIADLSGAYQSFSGKSDAMEGSVKFIIETEAIELDED